MSTAAEATKAARRDWIGLAVIALPCLLYSMDLTVLNLAVPHLTADLQPTGTQLLWIVDIYGFLVAGALITMGTLGDRIGRRRLLLIGAATFGLTSVLAAYSSSAEMLIVARALLGLAAATMAPSTLSLIRNMFHDSHQRSIAIGVWIASFSAGGAIGPLLGGVLLECFWWGSVFLLNVPIMLLLLAVGPSLLPEFRDPEARGFDLTSAALSLVALLTTIYGVKRFAESDVTWLPGAAILVGFGLGALFVRRQLRLADPLIDPRLFRSPAFSASLAVNILGFFVAFGTFLFIAQYFQLVLGMGPLEAGLWTAPSGLGFIVGSQVAPRAVRRIRPAYVMAGGLVVAAIGFAAVAQAGGPGGLPVIVIGYVLLYRDGQSCLILGEAGSGKSREMEEQARQLRATGTSAVFVDLRDLLGGPLLIDDDPRSFGRGAAAMPSPGSSSTRWMRSSSRMSRTSPRSQITTRSRVSG